MRRMGRVLLGILAVAFAAVNIVYWDDPWLWRGYYTMMASGADPRAVEVLTPYEEIRGDGSYVLPVASPESRTISAAALDASVAYARDFASHALIIVHKGVVQLAWYGDHWSAEKLTQSQSMHKTLMGLLIGVAIEDGKIASVDDPIGGYLTEWKDDPRGRITLAQMLTMSSGLGQPRFGINPFSPGVKWMNSGRSGEVILAQEMAGWAPGTKYDYNNLNSELLGMVLQRVYQKPYSEILREKVWLPMGGEVALVHTDRPGGRAFTSCCLAAPAMDWARFGMMLLNKGEVNGKRIVSSAWVDRMITRSPTARHYGYQTWLGYDDPPVPAMGAGSSGAIASEPFLAPDVFWTAGRGQQHVFVVPSRELVIVRLGPALGRQPIKPGFDLTFFVNTAIRGLEEPTQAAAE